MAVDKTPIEKVMQRALNHHFAIERKILNTIDDYCHRGAKAPEDREEIEQKWNELQDKLRHSRANIKGIMTRMKMIYKGG